MRLDDTELAPYLARLGLWSDAEAQVEVPGPGNINYVRRVVGSSGERRIVKQARRQLEKFPEYEVTTDRLLFEQRFLEHACALVPEASSTLPGILHFDPDARVLVLEDLGDGPDLRTALARAEIGEPALRELGSFLGRLHARSAERAAELRPLFANQEMQALHGEHIFTHPYAPNDFPVSPEIRKAAEQTLAIPGLREAITRLRQAYYETQTCLVHGDVVSDNLLLRKGRLRLIDAEIAHIGDPAFDLGCALAQLRYHRALQSAAPPDDRPPGDPGPGDPGPGDPGPGDRGLGDLERALLDGYVHGRGHAEDLGRAQGYAGVEILRRTFGAAREPLMAEPEAARAGMAQASELLREV